ncbi:4-hydroxybenzoate octaprenyltransferase [Tropicimonas sp.]|uniref:4-hydroxybenzoate octaprenyltransferase n=1 Tax=Tropicimonas sp. TaxID=2067044 RepID=UPI003A8BA454
MTENRQTPESSPSPAGTVADAVAGNWVDRIAPERFRPYLRLSRADRPIGFWTLIIPSWWGLFAAAGATGWRAQDWWILVAVVLGSFLMRGAGCTWNDLTDREFDGRVERTRSRPLPSGQISVRNAYRWLALQLALAFLILLTFNATAIWVAVASLALVALYPFGKRFTWWPQFILGLNLSWGVLVAWAAHAGALSFAPLFLFLGGVSWTIYYDTIYAHQDIEDDTLIGLKSTARLFGRDTPSWLNLFTMISVLMWSTGVIFALSGRGALPLGIALAGVLAMGWHMNFLTRTVDLSDPKSCLYTFRELRTTGMILVVALVLALLV